MIPAAPSAQSLFSELSRSRAAGIPIALVLLALAFLGCGTSAPTDSAATAEPERGPRTQPGTGMGLYAPGQHDLYDGKFIISGSRIYQVGTLNDESPWDHMGNDGMDLRAVGGTAELGYAVRSRHCPMCDR